MDFDVTTGDIQIVNDDVVMGNEFNSMVRVAMLDNYSSNTRKFLEENNISSTFSAGLREAITRDVKTVDDIKHFTIDISVSLNSVFITINNTLFEVDI